MESLGILTLGQSPRPELEELFRTYLPQVPIMIEGALDLLEFKAVETLSSDGEYPLLVVLRDGSTREIPMRRLISLLEQATRRLAKRGACQAILMCAAEFPDLDSLIPLIYPGRLVCAVVQALAHGGRLGVVTPNPGQAAWAKKIWRNKGFAVVVEIASPKRPDQLVQAAERMRAAVPDLVVMDCMGFSPSQAQEMRRLSGCQVICPQSLLARVCADLFAT